MERPRTYKLVWDKCDCCWCVHYLYMHSSRASLFAGGFWVSGVCCRLIACPFFCRQGNLAVLVGQGHHHPSSTLLTSASALVTAPIGNMWPLKAYRPSLSVARPPSTTSAASSDCPNALSPQRGSSSSRLAECGVEHTRPRAGASGPAAAIVFRVLHCACGGSLQAASLRSCPNVFDNIRARWIPFIDTDSSLSTYVY